MFVCVFIMLLQRLKMKTRNFFHTFLVINMHTGLEIGILEKKKKKTRPFWKKERVILIFFSSGVFLFSKKIKIKMKNLKFEISFKK